MSGILTGISSGYAPAGSSSPTPDILWWKLNDGSGTNITAAVGPAATTNAGWTTGASGSGHALSCNGTSNYVLSSSSLTYASATKITVSTWVNITSTGVDQMLMEGSTDLNTGGWGIYILSGNLVVAFQDNAGNSHLGTCTGAPSTGAWHNILVAMDGSTSLSNSAFKVYWDTVSKTASESGSYLALTFSDYILNATSRNGGSSLFYGGGLDDVRVYSGDQSSHVAAIYADPQ